MKDLESLISELRKKSRDHDDLFRVVDGWLKQLIDEIKLLLPGNADSMDIDSAPSMLQFSQQPEFEQHLKSYATSIRGLVERLNAQTAHFTPDQSELHAKVTSLLAAEKVHLAELESLRAETSDLDERLQNASLRYMVAEKKLDRAKSLTAAKLDKGMLLGGSAPVKDEAHSGEWYCRSQRGSCRT